MKKKLQNNNDFDDFYKQKYSNDIIQPSPELQENINKNLTYKNISANYSNIRNLKIAGTVLAVALIATFAYFEVAVNNTKNEKLYSQNLREFNSP